MFCFLLFDRELCALQNIVCILFCIPVLFRSLKLSVKSTKKDRFRHLIFFCLIETKIVQLQPKLLRCLSNEFRSITWNGRLGWSISSIGNRVISTVEALNSLLNVEFLLGLDWVSFFVEK